MSRVVATHFEKNMGNGPKYIYNIAHRGVKKKAQNCKEIKQQKMKGEGIMGYITQKMRV